MQVKNKLIAVCCMVCFTITLFAQPKGNSPYSRLGLGDLISPLSATQLSMGGLTAAYHDAYHSNIMNPASYGYLRSTSFQMGLNARYATVTTSENDELGVWNGNISYMYLGFPMRNPLNEVLDKIDHDLFWSMGVSLTPYTQVGYDIRTESAIANIDTVAYSYQGEGGTYKLLWGNSVRYKRLSVGVNMGYLFGKLINDRGIDFLDLEGEYQDIFEDEMRVNGFVWNVGAQYDYVFKKPNEKGDMIPTGTMVSVGAYGNNSTKFKTNSSQFYRRYNPTYSSFSSAAVDTLVNTEGIEGEGVLPSEIGFGITFKKAYHYMIGIDYKAAGWGKYENSAKPEILLNTFKVSVGGEYIPDFDSYNSYLKKIRYRAGFFYGTDPRGGGGDLNEQLTDVGITFGFGLPIILKQQASFVNIAFEIGKFGTDTSTLSENYFKTTVGFTLNNNQWFYKRKFN